MRDPHRKWMWTFSPWRGWIAIYLPDRHDWMVNFGVTDSTLQFQIPGFSANFYLGKYPHDGTVDY